MPCRCATSTLALFVRRIAQIDLESASLQTRRRKLFSVVKRNFTDRPCIEFPHTARSTQLEFTSSYSVSTSQEPLYGKPSNEKGTFPRHITPAECLIKNNLTTRELGQNLALTGAGPYSESHSSISLREELQCDAANLELPPAVVELTPEVIDTLAAESLRYSLSTAASTKSSSELNSGQAKPSPKGYYSPLLEPSKTKRKVYGDGTQSVAENSSSTGADRQNGRLVITKQPWQVQKAALKGKFKDGWNPRKKLSPDALGGIRAIHAQFPEQYTTSVLAEKFEVSPEAIRRILKSNWVPKEEEELDRQRRWFSRGKKVWSRYAELGVKPPARWRQLGIGKMNASVVDRSRPRSNERTTLGIRNVNRMSQDSDEGFRPDSLADRIL